MFAVQVTRQARGAVFALRGELDFDSVVQLHEAGDDEVARGAGEGPVVVDCAGLAFCDSSGIGALLRLFHQLAAQDRALRLAAVPTSVARLFSITGLDRVFSVYTDAEQALAAGTGGHDRMAADTNGTAQPMERRNT
ncbi:STAS domain-containing protein [Streptomyces sp. NPDC057939]|uniref:STAS domain-containing protein n=1 Tax=Streptomyces sp. NPDC057939 TaxID=3346284 RepID=UPI0036E7BC6E